ncbi:MAG TPA: 16S rRNA (adenine(1518)-N(6)/adenine(1519)-N(6))-dimethyltransferase RsmA [Clostridia bacterium]|mgnify:FL=1|jgi:16S rRNA (adenine1518-N6/adenine1519-N6)-dimethyltransferase|nr:MAG: Ribosomal RNA small subunit methyltransferase A [Firmicutes bacterium ADurb.Bin146]HOD93120.1 16S rRNA (adenine(1518)-N(6)/adenine(1519)-N(6))-dimethyltransferase RsmA [Clostridia bacterium]HQM39083.1 16S rRNA (adenine(1518)-N(6)/adenine(1519)-N(6))-dimethyltransferase RsmA [Clostridia bacterium]
MKNIDNIIPLPNYIRAKKALGQNFLIDKTIALKIVEALDLGTEDTVIEVGSGTGAITSLIAPLCKKLYAIETDQDLIKPLLSVLGKYDNVEIINKDILKTNIKSLINSNTRYKTVANLPYYITTPVISKFLEEANLPDVMVFMMQKEVAERICEKEGSRIYGSFTIYVNYKYQASFVADVPPESFIPSPKVTSTVLKFTKREKPLVEVPSEEFFFSVVRAAFSQRRKKLSNCISAMPVFNISKEAVEDMLTNMDIRADARAEYLSIEQFAQMSWNLYNLKTK